MKRKNIILTHLLRRTTMRRCHRESNQSNACGCFKICMNRSSWSAWGGTSGQGSESHESFPSVEHLVNNLSAFATNYIAVSADLDDENACLLWITAARYFSAGFNLLDFSLVILSVLDTYFLADSSLGSFSGLKVLRMLRLVRLLKLLRMSQRALVIMISNDSVDWH